MKYGFSAEEWSGLTPLERASHCRSMATEARDLASDAAPKAKLSYLKIAEEWTRLADAIERGK